MGSSACIMLFTTLKGVLMCTCVVWCSLWCCQIGSVRRRWISSSRPSPPCWLLAQCTTTSSGIVLKPPHTISITVIMASKQCLYHQHFSRNACIISIPAVGFPYFGICVVHKLECLLRHSPSRTCMACLAFHLCTSSALQRVHAIFRRCTLLQQLW